MGGNGRNALKSSQKQGRQLCAFNRLSTICVVYYTDKRLALRHFLRKTKKAAVEKAWQNAKDNLNFCTTFFYFCFVIARGDIIIYLSVYIIYLLLQLTLKL